MDLKAIIEKTVLTNEQVAKANWTYLFKKDGAEVYKTRTHYYWLHKTPKNDYKVTYKFEMMNKMNG